MNGNLAVIKRGYITSLQLCLYEWTFKSGIMFHISQATAQYVKWDAYDAANPTAVPDNPEEWGTESTENSAATTGRVWSADWTCKCTLYYQISNCVSASYRAPEAGQQSIGQLSF